MQNNTIQISKSAKYVTLGQVTDALEQLWYIFHGYGQLANDILQEFSYFDKGTRLFVAPEGLSRFYINGTEGKVGASWMTSEERLTEISDYIQYIKAVHEKVTSEMPDKDIKTVLFGFSQGVATVCRWLEQLQVDADKLILWAGTIPPETDLWRIKAHYPSLEVYLIAGTQDPYARSDIIREQEERLEKAALNYRKIRFDGKHELHPPTLVKLFNL